MATQVPNDLDTKMLSLADHMSPEAISRELGGVISPARVAVRVKELLTSSNWLTDYEQEQLVIDKMRKILRKLDERYLDLDNAKVQLQLLRAVAERLDKRRSATQDELNSLHANHAQLLYECLQILIEKAALDEEARNSVRAALPEAVYVISARNMGDEVVQ